MNTPFHPITKYITSNIPIVDENTPINEIKQQLTTNSSEYDSIAEIYVTSSKNHTLAGRVNIRTLLASTSTQPIGTITTTPPVILKKSASKTLTANQAIRSNETSIPVISNQGKLLGVITSESLLHLMHSQAFERGLIIHGILPPSDNTDKFDETTKIPITQSLAHRLPWLVVGLGGGLLTSGIVGSFEETLSKNLILAAFIPLIVYMADAVGAQMEAFIIRDLATNTKIKIWTYIQKQLEVVSLIAIILGVLLYITTRIFYHDQYAALVIAISLAIAIITSVFSGLIIPYIFNKVKLDPANASGPIATILQDLVSVAIYLGIASLLLN